MQMMREPLEASDSLRAGGRSPYLLWLIWVVWLPFFLPAVISLFQAHLPLWSLIAMLVGVALFVGIYLWGTWRTAQHLVAAVSPPGRMEVSIWLTAVVLTTLSLVLALAGHSSQWIASFIFTSGYIGGSLPIPRVVQAIAVLALLIVISGWFIDLSWSDLIQGVVFVAAVAFVITSVLWSIRTSWELRAAREEIARLAVTAERLRIARDLHDLLGHNLSLITLKSELAGRLLGVVNERAASEIKDIEQVARTTLQEVREAVASYRQPTLLSELHGAQEILSAAGIAYHYKGDESIMNTLPSTIEAVLAWTLREGVTNVIKHSRAHQCQICLMREKQTICVEITNDGATFTGGTNNGGNGLHGLAERVDALGGRFEAGSYANGGFRLAVSVPLLQRTAPGQQMSIASSIHCGSYEERRKQQ
jgi:two-component system sensor histidine kinase DesK